jgi:hypothetical protein
MTAFTGKGDPRAFLKQWGMLVMLLTDITDPAALSLLLVVQCQSVPSHSSSWPALDAASR